MGQKEKNMKPADYKCGNCLEITELTIKDSENFPEKIKCPFCGGGCRRIFTPLHGIVHRGKCGNYKNGYESSPVAIKKT